MLSFVVCSVEPEKFAALEASLAACAEPGAYEVVGIHDARSLCEGWRRGLERAAGEFGARLVIADLGLPGQDVHDPVKVSATLGALLHDRR